MIRLVQVTDGATRRVAVVDEPLLRLLDAADSIYGLAHEALRTGTPLSLLTARRTTEATLPYDDIYDGRSDWRLLPPIDHPQEPSRCLLSGTGLTHVGSARDRHEMHEGTRETATDSMRMFEEGIAGGRPEPGSIGVAPEWFYKGNGTSLRAHGEALVIPPFAQGDGEEAEIAGIYVIDADGRPRRIGMAVANEFSDHQFERTNYLNLAGSKLRPSALGPELVVNPSFDSVEGEVWIERGRSRVWSRRIGSGEAEMSHSLQNIEHHHFKFDLHRRSGDVHVHFFGAHSLSFGDGVTLADGDIVTIRFEGFGRPLRNIVRFQPGPERVVTVCGVG